MENAFRNKTACCFTGHRPFGLPSGGDAQSDGMRALLLRLDSAIHDAANCGVTAFYAGGAAGFDTLAAEAVLRVKDAGASVRLFLKLPGRDQHKSFSPAEERRFLRILDAADGVDYAADTCSVFSMQARNRALVDASDVCVCYLARMKGGTLYTVNYALDCGIPVINLAL